jgi:hypothetical protein
LADAPGREVMSRKAQAINRGIHIGLVDAFAEIGKGVFLR